MARAIHVAEPQSMSLAALATRYGVGRKGDEVVHGRRAARASAIHPQRLCGALHREVQGNRH
jgi:hypothetical protein